MQCLMRQDCQDCVVAVRVLHYTPEPVKHPSNVAAVAYMITACHTYEVFSQQTEPAPLTWQADSQAESEQRGTYRVKASV